MGKGSFDGRTPTALEWSMINKLQYRKDRIARLESLGYEVKCDNGLWLYRQVNTNKKWTLMDGNRKS